MSADTDAWVRDRIKWRKHDNLIISALPAKPEGVPDFVRVGGGAECEICGRSYYRHPRDPRYVDWDGTCWLTVLCDGRLVKL